jgi:chemotaxis protein CheX
MINDLECLVGSAVTELFSTMLCMEMRPLPLPATLGNGEAQIAGAVGFIGRLSGVVYVYTDLAFARRITATLLGLAESEIEGEEMINDAIGEVANMLVGNLKSHLSDRGNPCVLTIPSVVRGSHFSIEPVSTIEGHVFAFESKGNRIYLQVLLKPADQNLN